MKVEPNTSKHRGEEEDKGPKEVGVQKVKGGGK